MAYPVAMEADIETLDDAALSALELDAIAEAFVTTRRAVHFAHRVVKALPNPERRRALIGLTIDANRTAKRPDETLLSSLFQASIGDPEAQDLALSVAWGTDQAAYAALDLLIAQRHPETLAKLDAELEEAIAARPPTWTNGHATEWLAPSIRAAFLRAGAGATERFAAHLGDDALGTEAGLQVAASILLIGTGFVARHQVTETAHEGPVIAADPRFFALASRLTGHGKLKRLATDVLQLAPAKERKAVVGANPPGTFAAPAKSKAKAVKYKEGDQLRMFQGLRDWRGKPVTISKVHASGHLEIVRTDGLPSALLSPSSVAPLRG